MDLIDCLILEVHFSDEIEKRGIDNYTHLIYKEYFVGKFWMEGFGGNQFMNLLISLIQLL